MIAYCLELADRMEELVQLMQRLARVKSIPEAEHSDNDKNELSDIWKSFEEIEEFFDGKDDLMEPFQNYFLCTLRLMEGANEKTESAVKAEILAAKVAGELTEEFCAELLASVENCYRR